MTAPSWTTTRQPATERPWVGMVVLAGVPVLSLILIRMFWSGSGLWFLTVGILLLGAAAVVFLARRNGEHPYGTHTLAQEPSRVPLVLAGLGVLFLAMLILPNFAGGSSSPDVALPSTQNDSSGAARSDVAGAQTAPRRVVQQSDSLLPTAIPSSNSTTNNTSSAADSTNNSVDTSSVSDSTSSSVDTTDTTDGTSSTEGLTYIVQDGDTLWDIAEQFGVSVDAIVAANDLPDEASISIDQELIIPSESGG